MTGNVLECDDSCRSIASTTRQLCIPSPIVHSAECLVISHASWGDKPAISRSPYTVWALAQRSAATFTVQEQIVFIDAVIVAVGELLCFMLIDPRLPPSTAPTAAINKKSDACSAYPPTRTAYGALPAYLLTRRRWFAILQLLTPDSLPLDRHHC